MSRQTPTRSLSLTIAIISLKSSNLPPMTFPAPAMFSNTVTQNLVSECALLSAFAMRLSDSERESPSVDPGLNPNVSGIQNIQGRPKITAGGLLKVVQTNPQSLTTLQVVDEAIVCFLSLFGVTIGKIYQVRSMRENMSMKIPSALNIPQSCGAGKIPYGKFSHDKTLTPQHILEYKHQYEK